MWADFREGLGYVRTQTWLWGTFLSAAFAYLLFLGPTEVLLPFVVKQLLHGSATELGLVLACGGVSAVLVSFAIGQLGLPRRFISFMYVTWSLATLAVAGYGIATRTWQLALACAVVNGLETAGIVAWGTAKQRLVPAGLLGRVSGLDWFVSISLIPLSYALTAPVAAAVGARWTLVGAGVLGAVVTLAFLFLPGMRTVERAPRPEDPPPADRADPADPADLADRSDRSDRRKEYRMHPSPEARASRCATTTWTGTSGRCRTTSPRTTASCTPATPR
ncbi:MFS transporter [Streptacidiphilus sp. 4-A2]|nr:MFS transporter [Streptacidiphilus sp. 4-A2]